jgi:acetyl esterase
MSLLLGHPVQPKRLTSLDEIPERRRLYDLSVANADLPDVAALHERVELRPGLTAEISVPLGEGPFPVFLYMHGGAWCLGGAAGVRKVAHRITEHGFVVCNLDYRLAPEHPFPAAVEDTVYAARWLTRNAERFGGDGGSVAIGGDSAGAQLSAGAIVHLAGGSQTPLDGGDLDGVPVGFSAALLLYGVFDFPLLVQEPGSNVGSLEVMYNRGHLGPGFLGRHRDPLVSAVFAPNLAAFPPCYLSCGDEDSLLGQTLSMTRALTAANVPTTTSVVAGADHAFWQLEHVLPAARPEVERGLAWLRDTVAAPPPRIGDPEHPAARILTTPVVDR